MRNTLFFLWTSVGKKIILALAGLALCLFVLLHLLGNLTLFSSDPDMINKYAHKLESFGWLLYALEIGLAAVFLAHIISAVTVTLGNIKARPESYKVVNSAGPPSRKNISSTTMIYTGLILSIFLFIHLKDFKFGPGVEQGYVAHVGGEQVRNFYTLVQEKFTHIGYVIFYTGVMVLLGFHLRHGFWSAFQTLGLAYPRLSPLIYTLGVLFAIAIGLGFLAIPLYFYFTGGVS